jgi:hypothetical protein
MRAARALASLRTVAEVRPREEGAALERAPEGERVVEGRSAACAAKARRRVEAEIRKPKTENRRKFEIRRPKAWRGRLEIVVRRWEIMGLKSSEGGTAENAEIAEKRQASLDL